MRGRLRGKRRERRRGIPNRTEVDAELLAVILAQEFEIDLRTTLSLCTTWQCNSLLYDYLIDELQLSASAMGEIQIHGLCHHTLETP